MNLKLHKRELVKKILVRENFYRLGLSIFGFTFFPGIIFLVGKIFFKSSGTISAYYSNFYGSLLDLGMSGMYAWCVACTPYLAYDIYLLIKSFRTPKTETGQKED